MHLHFLGTRGNIRIRSKVHYNHASLLITHNNKRIMIDCGDDYKNLIEQINPDAICITHAHSDHVGGLKYGAPCPVYATLETWQVIKRYPISDKRIITPGLPITIAGLTVNAYAVLHAINAPAVGYRISHKAASIFYASDLVKICKQKEALHGVDLYIGDGAIIKRNILIKKRGATYIGHAPVITQMRWCKKEHIPHMIITHCGTEIVSHDIPTQPMNVDIQNLGGHYGIDAILAYDGMQINMAAYSTKN